ncbi:hypothetical protein BDN72DRAFT_906722 [Pluteus cervinus]|uniref:Uncharacterized protein n=1 Tax=Pluteus cervinus TaxID=181527 RepID=A0ACD2ZYF4_9AGAR|nr:hypothetical protein BDN72DRAFT_906722 [Pluteus cervinus]
MSAIGLSDMGKSERTAGVDKASTSTGLVETVCNERGLTYLQDMRGPHQLFTTVENYEQMNIHYLSHPKISKVTRHIAVLEVEKVLHDAEFHSKDQAKPNSSENWGLISEREDEKEERLTSATAALDVHGKTEAISALPGGLSGQASRADIR